VFVDVDPASWTIAERVSAAVSERTKAIVPVHIYGHPAAWSRFGLRARIPIVEDAAQAHLARYHGSAISSSAGRLL
jgi:dTDP-4-amino-4,6-dideoxygalactose transaminase